MQERPPTRRTQVQRREEAECRIIDAAIELIASRGTALLTMAEIGIHAGYSRGLPHKHFGTKERIIEQVLESLMERFNHRRRSKKQAPGPGLQSIRSVVDIYFDRDEQQWLNSKALLIMMAEATLVDSPQRERMGHYNRRNIDFMKKHLGIARERGEIRCALDDEEVAVFIFGALRGIVLQMQLDGSIRPAALQKAFSKIVDTILEPVQAPAAVPPL